MMQFRHAHTFVLLVLMLILAPALSVQAQAADHFDLAVLAFVDLNGDGAYGLSQGRPEPALAGVDIKLYTDNSPLHSHGPEDTLLATLETSQDGYVVFHTLSAGDYVLVGSLQDGYLPTTPLEQWVSWEGGGQGAVLEFTFGQLQRSAFKYHYIFPLVATFG